MKETEKRMSADGIIRSLRLCADKEDNFTSCVSGQLDCPFSETVIDCEQRMKRASADVIATATARIAELEAVNAQLQARDKETRRVEKLPALELAKLLRLAYEIGREDEREHPGAECLRDFAGDAAKLTERELSE